MAFLLILFFLQVFKACSGHVSLAVAPVSAAPAPAPIPPPPNVTQIMESAGQLNTFISLLIATQVDLEFQTHANDTTTGITIFAPTDKAFASLPSGLISKLTAQNKITLCEYHALSAFYPLSALQQATDPVTPTLATDKNGAGRFTVNVTNQQGTVRISTGRSNADIISTLYNTVPCAIFEIDQVLLPLEIFGPAPPSPAPSPVEGFPSLSPSSSKSGTAASPTSLKNRAPALPSVYTLLSALLLLCGCTLL